MRELLGYELIGTNYRISVEEYEELSEKERKKFEPILPYTPIKWKEKS